MNILRILSFVRKPRMYSLKVECEGCVCRSKNEEKRSEIGSNQMTSSHLFSSVPKAVTLKETIDCPWPEGSGRGVGS